MAKVVNSKTGEMFGWHIVATHATYEELKESMYPKAEYADYTDEEIEVMMQKAKWEWWDEKDGKFREFAEGSFHPDNFEPLI